MSRLYSYGPETMLHALWDCHLVKKVWKQTFLNEVCTIWRERDFLDLFIHVASMAHGLELEWFGVIVWFL